MEVIVTSPADETGMGRGEQASGRGWARVRRRALRRARERRAERVFALAGVGCAAGDCRCDRCLSTCTADGSPKSLLLLNTPVLIHNRDPKVASLQVVSLLAIIRRSGGCWGLRLCRPVALARSASRGGCTATVSPFAAGTWPTLACICVPRPLVKSIVSVKGPARLSWPNGSSLGRRESSGW